jgi:uncharacterized DUF497 family protein
LKIFGLIWLQEIIEKIIVKHSVSQDEIKEILFNSAHFRFVEKGYRPGENVYASLGQTDSGRYLVVFFIYKKDHRALILSARDMTPAERKRYERK